MTQHDPAGADEPRYGQRVSPEELEEILREQGIEPHRPDDGQEGTAPTGAEADPYLRGSAPRGGAGALAGRRPTSRPGRRRGLLVTGLVLLVVLPLALSAAALGVSLDGSSTSGAALGENGLVYLEAGQPRALYRAGLAAGSLDCTVTDPAGTPVETHGLEGMEGAEVSYLSFVPSTSGTYTVTCAGGTSDIVVGPALKEERVLVSGMLLLTALASGAAGLVLTVLGLLRR
ncbi:MULTISPECIES: hypothetical protein [unclassified Actinomyces]|uniref:hypothetical protein n=1 Tax=unclassified Actinomyces TaxID=2609248 RepID=UPI00201796AB|nr:MULTISPECIES: hypothetical protein [unclassified Actinomyces]MCL3778152.1 hypothetical protein [Actinomyces sp. AC-20-1]MCL3789269.1 hypothetical protein [Actinomyces sp. 187325]MCL3791689.1 hypothetical protein [Actinomyces sp. 186855]MCL3794271.1 hypothetical protein [Actinomyces sp. 217892]